MIKRLVKIKEVEDKSLNDLINEFIQSLEPPEYVIDVKILESGRSEQTGISYLKEGGTWRREIVYYTAYIYVGG